MLSICVGQSLCTVATSICNQYICLVYVFVRDYVRLQPGPLGRRIFHKPNIQRTRASLLSSVYMFSICVGQRLRTSATSICNRYMRPVYMFSICVGHWSETTYVCNQVPWDAGSVSPVTKVRQL